jgi:tRNA threonylcarbamoyladenosine biosynthesis protein TsaE
VIELVSDIGGGKTTFVRGLAKGLGSTDQVSSPTYTINQIYQAGTKEIHHYDFYRLQEAGVVGDELREEMGQPNVVTVIEWGDIVHNVLPEDKITITFKRMSENDDRLLTVAVPESHSYLSEGTEA